MAKLKLKNANIAEEKLQISTYMENQFRATALNLKHPLQRKSEQWSKEEKSNLIRRMLWNEPIPRLYIVEQEDKNGIPTRHLVDGLQRFTTIQDFLEDDFVISKKTRMPIVTYMKSLYKMTTDKKGKEVPELDEKGRKIPLVDDGGIGKKELASFDIRGKKFSQLPEDLQKAFKMYQLCADVRRNGTNEDIQNDILDYNSGRPMNKSQIGVNLMGIGWAKAINKLADHDFISDVCGFSLKDSKNGNIMRAINEALMYINFHDDWKSNPKDIGEFLGGHLQQSYIEDMRSMFDCLYEVLPSDDADVQNMLKLKSFLILISNFYAFMDMGYSIDCYRQFIQEWFNTLSSTKSSELHTGNDLILKDGSIGSYDEYCADRNTKEISILDTKVNYMNAVMEKWLGENCTSIDDGSEGATEDNDASELNNTSAENEEAFYEAEDYLSFKLNIDVKTAERLLMVTSDYHYANFSNKEMQKFIGYFANQSDEKRNEIMKNAEDLYLSVNEIHSAMDGADHGFFTDENKLCLIASVKKSEITNPDDLLNVLMQFVENESLDTYYKIPRDNPSYIIGKISFLSNVLHKV